MAGLKDLSQLKETLASQELQSFYADVINVQEALLNNWSGDETVIVDEGCDERNGSYPFEVHVSIAPSVYVHDKERGDWIASRTYAGGLNRLSSNRHEYFDTKQEAAEFAKRNWF